MVIAPTESDIVIIKECLLKYGDAVSYEQFISNIQSYVLLLLNANKQRNLIAKSTEDIIFRRHIIDCLQMVTAIGSVGGYILDIGSGAGLPGLVLACASKTNYVLLAEKSPIKCMFLQHIMESINIQNASIIQEDVYNAYLPANVQYIVSRAMCSVLKMLNIVAYFKIWSVPIILLKGETYQKEIDEAMLHYTFNLQVIPSIIHDKSATLVIKNINLKEKA